MIHWPFDPTVYAGLALLSAGYWALGRSVSDARRKHHVYAGLAVFTLWVALETPIDVISDEYLDSVHMLQHVLLGFVAPPFMLLALSPGMVERLLRLPGVQAVTEPVPAQVIAGVVMIGWHVPPLYDATLRSEVLHVFEHLTFIASGVLLYWPMLEVTSARSRHRMSPAVRLVYMLIATLPQDGVALALIFSRVPFYSFYAHAPRLIAGYTPLIDQTIAGAVLMVLGKATLAWAALVTFFRWFGREQRADELRAGSATL